MTQHTAAVGLFKGSRYAGEWHDKIVTVPREKIRYHIGVLEREILVRVDRSLALFLGVA